MISRIVLASLVFVAVASALTFPPKQDFTASSDQITNLPGLSDSINFNQYAGYVTVDQSHGRKLFYWFVESQRNPASDKVVLWLNGGPGCSSLGGLFEENGPFRPQPNGDLFLNPQSWNKVANVIYLESPSGVGFSYSDTKSDYETGDQQTAQDAYNFLQTFFQMYPQFNNHSFWITGESYAGHYIPELAKLILDENAAGNPKINIEGFMAGNPWTYAPIDNYGAAFYWWTHALISDESFYGMNSTCDYANIGPLKKRSASPDSLQCNKYISQATQEMGNINIYDIYVDVCPIKSGGYLGQMAKYSSFHQVVQETMGDYIDPAYQPCLDNHLFEYLNRKDVQQAIHANISYPWIDCSVIVQYNYTDVLSSVIPLYQYFQQNTNLKILVYSGDVDAIVPYTGTRQWIADLNWPIKTKWTEWLASNGQVSGYVTVYDGLTFATVRDAGHMVPETQPERAFQMFSNFLYKYAL
jgi:serine carboxypeptidase-like clade 2